MTLSPQVRQLVEKYVANGATAPELAELFNTNLGTMRSRLRHWGLRPVRVRVVRHDQLERNRIICAAYCAGQTLEAVGKAHLMTRERVRQILVANGITERWQWKPPKKIKPPRRTQEQLAARSKARFWTYVNITVDPEECWEWNRPFTTNYPKYYLHGVGHMCARQAAYLLTYGKPRGWVLSRCRNSQCCNPHHLYIGTPADSVRARDAAGKGPKNNPKYSRRLSLKEIGLAKELLKIPHLTQGQIAQQLDVGIATINKIATGKHRGESGRITDEQILTAWNCKGRFTTDETQGLSGVGRSNISAIWNGRYGAHVTGAEAPVKNLI